MKESKFDKQYKLIEAMGKRLDNFLMNEFKGVKPYGAESPSPIDRLYEFDNMTEMDMSNYMMQNGVEAWSQKVIEMDKIRRKLRKR